MKAVIAILLAILIWHDFGHHFYDNLNFSVISKDGSVNCYKSQSAGGLNINFVQVDCAGN